MSKKLTTEEFIEKAILIHGDRYDYSMVDYIGNKKSVVIICSLHGEFNQAPFTHLKGCGCQKCADKKLSEQYRKSNEDFISKAITKHGNKYDYSLVEYINAYTKVKIICPVHGIFEQTPAKHANAGNGCFKCGRDITGKKKNKNTEKFIKDAQIIHGDRYNYDKSIYTKAKEKLTIACDIHGDFQQEASSHLSGKGCPECGIIQQALLGIHSFDEVMHKIKQVHGDKYDYSKFNYIKSTEKVIIICDKHGEFIKTPSEHIAGEGCPYCSNESTGNILRRTTEEFINEAIEIHGERFNYDKVEYINSNVDVIITCLKHGDFNQTPTTHLKSVHCCPKCVIESRIGENNSRYNHELTKEEREDNRQTFENLEWRKNIYEKFDYTCVICDNRGYKINAHHLNGYHWDKENRFNINNGVVLCKDCHILFHQIYGHKHNTKEQFEEFMQLEFDETKEEVS